MHLEKLTWVQRRWQRLHPCVHRSGQIVRILPGTHVVSMPVGDTRNVHIAQQLVSGRLPDQNQLSWNACISASVSCGKFSEALALYQKMQQQPSLCPPFLALLKASIQLKDLDAGQILHAEIIRKGLFEESIVIGSTLIDMYVKCGSLVKAQEVFDTLPVQNVVSWSILLAGYAEYGEAQKVFECVEQMQGKGINPDAFTFVCMLKACSILTNITKGQEVYVEIVSKGLLEGNVHVGSSLVGMYINCSCLEEAVYVFLNLPIRNVVSWTILIAGLAKYDYCEDAFRYFDCMQQEGISPNIVTFVCGLKACAGMRSFEKGQELHTEAVEKGFEKDLLIGNTLIDMYAKCCFLEIAQNVLEKLTNRTVVSWNALISEYADRNWPEKVINLYGQMQDDGISPSVVTFICCLKACGSLGATEKGQETHAVVLKMGLDQEPLIASTLVNMYAKWGVLEAGQKVFDMILAPDIVQWNVLLAGYAGHGLDDEVLICYEKMQQVGPPSTAVTVSFILKACGSLGAVDKGKFIHIDVTKKGLEGELQIGNTLIDMYVKCVFLGEALRVFEMLLARDVVSWNTLISGCFDLGNDKDALSFVEKMQQDGVSLNAITFGCTLKVCGSIPDIIKGQEVHNEIIKQGLETELIVGSTLVDMYAKCGMLVEAHETCDKLSNRTIVSWNALLVAYIEHDEGKEALKVLRQMQDMGSCLDDVALLCGLKACDIVKAIGQSQVLHAEIVKRGFERELIIGNALVDVYAKGGMITDAQSLFNMSLTKDVATYTALLSGYLECGKHWEVLMALSQMQQWSIAPNALTIVLGLKACGSLEATMMGFEIHVEIFKKGLEGGLLAGNNLVEMYSKCGLLAEAHASFDELLARDVLSWNTLIAGYAQHGKSEAVFKSLDKMIGEGVPPDSVTFTSLLKVCTHAGLVDEGQMLCGVLGNYCTLPAAREHFTCIIDLLGRAGNIERVVAASEKLPLQPDLTIWHIVLGPCRELGLGELGRHAFEHAVELDSDDVAAYIYITNVCNDANEDEGG